MRVHDGVDLNGWEVHLGDAQQEAERQFFALVRLEINGTCRN